MHLVSLLPIPNAEIELEREKLKEKCPDIRLLEEYYENHVLG